ncbi:tRNA pseudouridine(38-40) synthase TruA [Thermotalea metallivorans]|uniref:tRNA pseudouridine synthase A n=1 Tax=Thermotalea metallivorans TaxID=520762 RepID=A0A140LDK9_9FIRM|nr:tRNA pseudouridine(38-40) synthase TruA [Thermotalea metallivorans]KXG78634.1 tRNA pseudouridine synthase A [Thermotalea metallivorans]
MRNIKLIMEYDGTRYNGWQRLGNTENTIQHKVENVLSRMTGENIEAIASGRTDAGVHAYHQVVNFKTNTTMTVEEIRDYCNQYLPHDIVVKKAEEVEDRFHARYHATSKKYLYRIWNGKIPTAFHRKYTHYILHDLDLDAMRKAAAYLVGEHDFRAFSSVKSKKKSTVRTLYSIDIHKEGSQLDMMFHGNGFLYNMVRIIVGTLIEVGEGKMRPEDIPEIMAGKVRAHAGVTAPAQGLFLYEVYYD